MNRNRELLKNTAILMIGQFVPKIMALIVLPILTGSLSKTDYGLYDLTLTVASFCIPLISVQIQQAVFRYLIEKESEAKSIISSSFTFLLFMFTISSLFIVAFWFLYTKNIVLSVLFMFSYIFEAILSWCGQAVRGLGHNINYSFAYAIYSVSFVTFLYSVSIITSILTLENVVLSMIIAYAISIVYLGISCRITRYICISALSFQTIKRLLSFSGPMVISAIALWVVNLSDRFCVSGFLGLEINAIYAVANKIPNLINSFYSVFNLAWTENTSRLSDSEKKNGYYSDFFSGFYNLLIGAMLCLITASPLLFSILISSKYADSYGLMSWLYVGVLFSSLVSFFGSIYVGEKKTKEVGVSSIIGAIINLSINLLFMKRFGVIVAAISTIVSYLIILLYRAFDIRKYVNIRYDFKQVLVGLGALLTVVLLNYTLSVYSVILSLAITIVYNVILNRKVLVRLMNKVFKRG